MKLTIDYKSKKVRAFEQTVVDAGWLGFEFARDNPDLVKDGWEILYFNTSPTDHEPSPVQHMGKGELARAIRNGPACTHTCKDHPTSCCK